MEPERFDRWTRRRFGLAAGGLITLLPALGWVLEGDAKPKKNGKKRNRDKPCPDCATCPTRCRKPRDRCEGGCCDGLVCEDNFCGPVGEVCCGKLDAPCKGHCDCCGSGSYCASDQIHLIGTCGCLWNRCGDQCVRGAECCADDDCGGNSICDDGFCKCPDESYHCGFSGTCCKDAPTEICLFYAETCEQGGCPETDYCTDSETYFCAENSFCTVSIDDARVCLDFDSEPCVDCASDAECQTLLGTDAACVPTGEFCSFCPTNYCARVHQETTTQRLRPQDNRTIQVERKSEVIAAADAASGASTSRPSDKRTEASGRRSGQKSEVRKTQNSSDASQGDRRGSRRRRDKKGGKDRCPACPDCSPGCEAVQQRCDGDCCEGLTCGQNFCQGPYDVCCREQGGPCKESCDCCGEYSVCRDGICDCRFRCGDQCVGRDDCCTDDECPAREVCRNGSCQCSPSTFFCGGECCDFETAGEICPTDENPRTCQAGGCPAHDFCTDNFAYQCGGDNCYCATSIDGVNTCIGNPFASTERIACESDAECETTFGQPAICVPDGLDCRFGTNICVRSGCPSPPVLRDSGFEQIDPVERARAVKNAQGPRNAAGREQSTEKQRRRENSRKRRNAGRHHRKMKTRDDDHAARSGDHHRQK